MDKITRIAICVTVVSALFSLKLIGQDIKVVSFKQLTTDMTARIDAPMKDQNGEVCAIIKVVTNETGFVWEPDGLGIIAAPRKTGEYWLYLPRGAQRLTIKHPDYGVLRNFKYPVPIESAMVYELILNSDNQIDFVNPDGDGYNPLLMIKTNPPEAMVSLNGKYMGLSPLKRRFSSGKYSYNINLPGYYPESGIVDLQGYEQEIKLEMRPNFGSVNVLSYPEEGMKIFLDDVNTGLRTPAVIEDVSSGTHKILLVDNYYQPQSKEVIISDNQLTNVSFQMKPVYANVTLNSLPGARLTIQGDSIGVGTKSLKLLEGVYDIKAEKDHHYPIKQQVNVYPGADLEIDLELDSKIGSLWIKSVPEGASVFIDGEIMGVTPLLIDSMIQGSRQYHISKQGYGTYFDSLFVENNKKLEINKVLKPGKNMIITTDPDDIEIFLDGKYVGNSPWNGNISFGSHKLKLVNNTTEIYREVLVQENSTDSLNFYTPEHIFTNEDFTDKVGNCDFDMIAVEGGSFIMGCTNSNIQCYDNELPSQEVNINDYYIGKYEITVKQFNSFVNETGYISDAEKTGNAPYYEDGEWKVQEKLSWKMDLKGKNKMDISPDSPVTHVTRNDALAFCEWLSEKTGRNYSLPTEKQWEFAARGGNRSKGLIFSGSNSLSFVGWYNGNSKNRPYPVGQKKPNELGIYDMSGNVLEYCIDKFVQYGKKVNKAINSDRYISRGGSFIHEARDCRNAMRNDSSWLFQNNFTGFRVAVTY